MYLSTVCGLLVFLIPDALLLRSSDCVKPYILGGRTTIRGRGRIALFICKRPFHLYGQDESTCLKGGRWFPEPPKCGIECPITHVKAGENISSYSYRRLVSESICNAGYEALPYVTAHCDSKLSNKSYPICLAEACAETYKFCNSNDCNVFAARNLNELYVSCQPGFSPIGADKILCDRSSRSTVFYGCRETRLQFSCSFEKMSDEYCGWGQPKSESKKDGAFIWFRKWRSDRFESLPDSDHTSETHAEGSVGVYLYLPAHVMKLGDVARLYSPTYELSWNVSHCFIFWYHMKSRLVGELNIFVNDELEWTIAGAQGAEWNEGFVPLPGGNVSIIVEATRGLSADGFIAIDDFSVTNSMKDGDHECFMFLKGIEPDEPEEPDVIPTTLSGENFDTDDPFQSETTLPSVNEFTIQKRSSDFHSVFSTATSFTHVVDLAPTKISLPETQVSTKTSKEILVSSNPLQEIPASTNPSQQIPVSVSPSQEIPTFANPSQQIPVSVNLSQEISTTVKPLFHVPLTLNPSLQTSAVVTSQSSNPSIPQRTVNEAVSKISFVEPKETSWSTTTFSMQVVHEISSSSANEFHRSYGDTAAIKPTSPTLEISSSPTEIPKTILVADGSKTKTTKPLPDTVEGIRLNVNKTESATKSLLPSTAFAIPVSERISPIAEGILKNKDGTEIASEEEDDSADMGNRIAGSERESDTRVQVIDPASSKETIVRDSVSSPVDETRHQSQENSDIVFKESGHARSGSHGGSKFLVDSKTQKSDTGVFTFKFPDDDFENGIDTIDINPHPDKQTDFDEYNCGPMNHNCRDNTQNIQNYDHFERQTSSTSQNDTFNSKESHQTTVETDEDEIHQRLLQVHTIDHSNIQGTQTDSSHFNSKLHNLIVSSTGILLVVMIVIVIAVFRVVRKRMKKQRRREGIFEDELSINLQMSSSKEILNFSLLRPDQA